MKKLILVLSLFTYLQGCGQKQLEAPEPPPFVRETPDNWQNELQARTQAKAEYIKQQQIAFDWFARFPFSETDGIPYIILMLLPEIAPELWGSQENFLDAVGLFMDEREQPPFPVAAGIGISAMTRSDPLGNIDYTSFTCAACHIGRVRKDNGGYDYLDGGVNTEFNIVKFRVNMFNTLDKLTKGETDPTKREENVIAGILNVLTTVHERDPNYFYRNYKNGHLNFDAAYERGQIELFRNNAVSIISTYFKRAESEFQGFAALVNKNYKGFEEETLKGFPGMADATGISSTNAYMAAQDNFFERIFSSFILPPVPGITDFMSVWEQSKREAEWDAQHKTLINGGGQWNGNIPIPMYRNMAAQLTLGLENNDLRVSAFGVELLYGLPASAYPFDVDVELAKRGEELFRANCAQCHQPNNGAVYDVGTNMDRAYVVGRILRYGAISSFSSACNPDTVLDMAGTQEKPCAEFRGVDLTGKKDLIMSPLDQHHGYNARPLSGIWAQAPYLHNGSVPTAYHLLVPGERPNKFVKSRLDYDKKMLGYAWQGKGNNGEGYEFDTTAFPPLTNAGHDKNIMDKDGNVYRLDWSDDKEGAWAIVEYMKTL